MQVTQMDHMQVHHMQMHHRQVHTVSNTTMCFMTITYDNVRSNVNALLQAA